MADMSTKQPVEGGAILDALSKLFFKGLDGIFDAAAEYQKEMGVLKQVNKIAVADKDGNKYELTVKLAPVKGMDGVYYMEVGCPGYSNFDGEKLHKKGIKLDKSNKDDFWKTIDEMLADNDLKRIEKDEEGEEQEVEPQKHNDLVANVYADFVSQKEEPYKVEVDLIINKAENSVEVRLTADNKLPSPFEDIFALDDESANIGKVINKHLVGACKLTVSGDNDREWSQFVNLLNSISKYANNLDDFASALKKIALTSDIEQSKTPTASIQVTLEKITANGHETVNLVSISSSTYTRKSAIDVIRTIVAADEFVDSMPEGESDYEITEDDDFFDIEKV